MQRAAACNVARGLASNLTDSRGAHRARAMRLAACGAGRRSAAAAPQAARPPRFTGAWQRTPHASRLHAVAVLEFNRSADEAASASLAPRTPSYPEALAASLSRTTFTWAQLMPELSTAGAAPAADGDMSRLLEQQRCTLETAATLRFWEGSALSDGGDGAVLPSDATFVSETLAEWTAVAHQRPSGFDQEAQLALTGVADVAVVTRGGRARGYWKIANQDAFALSSPSPDTLLLAVCDGHGRLGEGASQAAATGLAAAMPEHLAQAAAASSNGSNGSATSSSSSGSGSTTSTTNGSSSSADAAQRALVSAFQEVASRMQQDAAFVDCGTAVAACLVQPGSVSVAWAGDCRAVLGLSVGTAAGPKCLVHSLTRDHKPESPLEQRRIEATSRGKVMQTGPERPFRIAARDRSTVNTLSLSRGFGDSWAVPLGFTAEADAVTLLLPPPAPLPTTTASLKSPTDRKSVV